MVGEGVECFYIESIEGDSLSLKKKYILLVTFRPEQNKIIKTKMTSYNRNDQCQADIQTQLPTAGQFIF